MANELNEMTVRFDGKNYIATRNKESGFFELKLEAPLTGGIYDLDIKYTNLLNETYERKQKVQVLAKEEIKIITNKTFMWIFDGYDFSVKDIVELADYEINIDEETNANTILNVLKNTTAVADDIIAIKKDNEVVYWGIIDNIQNESGKKLYDYTTKYITNLFNQKVELKNESIIRTTGIEDFIAKTITDNFISNTDTFVNKQFLEVVVETHTKIEKSVDNVENGIYNLHTWMTNCTQNYNITYKISISKKKLRITIKKEDTKKELIDVFAHNISNYTEVFETDVVAKVKVLTKEEGSYTLYLLSNRTTTPNMNDENRAKGKVEIVYTEKMEDAHQVALDTMKQNTYNHMISFNFIDKYMKVGTPIAIKTKNSIILDTYISAVKIKKSRMYEYTCGNMRVGFIEKLKKEKRK